MVIINIYYLADCVYYNVRGEQYKYLYENSLSFYCFSYFFIGLNIYLIFMHIFINYKKVQVHLIFIEEVGSKISVQNLKFVYFHQKYYLYSFMVLLFFFLSFIFSLKYRLLKNRYIFVSLVFNTSTNWKYKQQIL